MALAEDKESLLGNGEDKNTMQEVFDELGFNPTFEYFKKHAKKADLKWRNISYTVGKKKILENISGHVDSGKVCALMGPSGSGKSSLMNVLAGRVIPSSSKKVEGKVFVNGETIDPIDFRTQIAYVMQDDLMCATATAREAIEFSARLRLPAKVSNNKQEIKLIVDDLLNSLGLFQVQHTKIGNEMIRGLSGGERKRVSIGVELVTNPGLLFLDEPTSGLDSFSAWKVVRILEALGSATGCAILCTIHQPSSEIFNTFNDIMMLWKGNVMYNGTVSNIGPVFKELGKPIPAMSNPADFLVFLAQTSESDKLSLKYNVDDIEKSNIKDVKKPQEVVTNPKEKRLSMESKERKVGIWTECVLLAQREFRNLRRNLAPLGIGIFATIFLNVIYGLIFQNVGDRNDPDFTVFAAFGTFNMLVSSTMFNAAQEPLLAFPLERGIFLREYRTGTYSAFPYLASKVMVEIPKALVCPFFGWLSAYFLIDYQGNFFAFVGISWLLSLSIASYGYTLGAIFAEPEQAQQFVGLLLVPQLLFAGLFVPIDIIPKYISWARYLCVFKYALNLAMIEEFGDCDVKDGNQTLRGECERIFIDNDIDQDMIYRDILLILAVFVVFRAISLIALIIRAKRFA